MQEWIDIGLAIRQWGGAWASWQRAARGRRWVLPQCDRGNPGAHGAP